MKEKLAVIKNKLTEFIKNKPILAWAIGTVIIAVIVAVIVSAIFFAGTSSNGDESGEANVQVKWGEGVTENIPEFKPAPDSVTSLNGTENSVAAYYTEVTGEQVSEYTSLVESECGVKFSSDKYPRSAIFGDKIIAIHYNVTEKKMSVTVVKTGENNETNQ